MKTKQIEMREEFFPSLPHVETKCFIDGKAVARGEFIRAIDSTVKKIADETHSAGGKTVRHIIAEVYAEKPICPPALAHLSLTDAEYYYQQGRISRDELRDYLRAWNAGPHFTQAVFRDGRIRNYDPEHKSAFLPHEIAEYGVRL